MMDCVRIYAVETSDKCSQQRSRVAIALSGNQIKTGRRLGADAEQMIVRTCAQAGLAVLEIGKNHIKPALGAVKLNELNTHTIQKFYNTLSKGRFIIGEEETQAYHSIAVPIRQNLRTNPEGIRRIFVGPIQLGKEIFPGEGG